MTKWSKRTTTKAGNSGQRVTRTRNSSGKSTYSNSWKPAKNSAIRITNSVGTNGVPKTYLTVNNPVTGRSTRRIDGGGKSTVKQIKSKPVKSIRRSRKSYSTSDDADLSFLFPFFLILIGLIVISNIF